jgi:hypothetical protein
MRNKIHKILKTNLELKILKAKYKVYRLSLTTGTPEEFNCIFSSLNFITVFFFRVKKNYGSIFTEVGWMCVFTFRQCQKEVCTSMPGR